MPSLPPIPSDNQLIESLKNLMNVYSLKTASPITHGEDNQKMISVVLDNIKDFRSYYAGGTLCVDTDKDVITFNLDETATMFSSGESILLDTSNTKKLFAIYLEHKGETPYYLEKFNESHIRHLVN